MTELQAIAAIKKAGKLGPNPYDTGPKQVVHISRGALMRILFKLWWSELRRMSRKELYDHFLDDSGWDDNTNTELDEVVPDNVGIDIHVTNANPRR